MKKTLLIAAAALAAGVITSQAQVYSQNVVGYINTTVPAHGYNLIANQLINGSDTSKTNNSINTAFSGLTSDVNGVNNTVLYLWNGSGYAVYQYFSGPDADNYFFIGPGSAAGFYDTVGNYQTASLNQSAGSFLYNPSASLVTATFVGTVPQGTNVVQIKPGFNLFSEYAPVSTNLESSLIGFPGTSDVNGVNNDVLYKWNGSGYAVYQYFSGPDADNYFFIGPGSPAGFYDTVGNLKSSAPAVAQGFFIYHHGAAVNWTQSFTVQ